MCLAISFCDYAANDVCRNCFYAKLGLHDAVDGPRTMARLTTL